jgi:hypothetical protein
MKHTHAAFAAVTLAALFSSVSASAQIKHAWWETKGVQGSTPAIPNDIGPGTYLSPQINAGATVFIGFEGNTQYDNALLGRNFIPPDTMGAVGLQQYMVTTNGSYGVYDKYTGARLSLQSDVAFWAAAGQTGANGDTRIMYNADAQRWVMVSFGGNTKDLQIAVSDTDNALGGWQSVKFEGYGGFGFGAVADYPTLALDKNAVYIGTNNFAPAFAGGPNSFRGTTLNVIPIDSLFGGGAPTVANMKQFVTPYPGALEDRGFAIQGVNSSDAGSTGHALAASLFAYDTLAYNINGLSSNSALGASEGTVVYLGEAGFQTAGPARQPSVDVAANRRVIDALDERLSSSVYEVDGRLYMIHTVDTLSDGLDEARLRVLVLDAANYAVLDEFDVGSAGYDYYQGSIAVNQFGEVVIGYNRSGLDVATGKIAFMARAYKTLADGTLEEILEETLLKESLTDDYHNGSIFGQPAAGRQRWGDYAQVSVDPSSPHSFYLIGQFAREYNLPQFGHPGGTGGSRWSTWVAGINIAVAQPAVPEPATWAMMIIGFGAIGVAMRRARPTSVSYS